ncbi:hypothetical protein VRRI112168_03595 [Vreelandella rituensis]|uniref:Uncharacterized protein n=1 Tax=Vreelandella rituensis TaxID=2282306 RepID=A0A368UB08_9GAMM|nr:hypothetical protein [Halomonas rituensis]RCV93737.1 hypothetical protein DU506_00865 [Halomonas rituensis]
MQLPASQLVIEYGGKLQACERQVNRALEYIQQQEQGVEKRVGSKAQEASVAIAELRARYNLLMAAHASALLPILNGTQSPDLPGETLMLNAEQAWVINGIDDLYDRLKATLNAA